MYALLSSAVATPGYAGTPSLATTPGWGSRQPPQETSGERRRVTIYRDSLHTPWGFRLHGGRDLNTPLSVKRVFSGSPADGQLTRDDLVLAIDDQPVGDLSSTQVLEKIKAAGGSIVLTIETSPYEDAAFDCNLNTARSAFQEPVRYAPPTNLETKISDYDSFQSSPAVSYQATDAAPQDHSRPAASPYYQKVNRPTQSRHRSANRFQAAPTVPFGLSEPGWTAKPKVGAREPPIEIQREPAAAAPEQPLSQHRSARQFQGSSDSSWRSQYGAVEDPSTPAWYGSLRSTRAAHSWEVRAAKTQSPTQTQSPTYEYAQQSVPTEPQVSQNTWEDPEQIQSQQSRTYKAEIRGLMLARPSYHQAQSTPEWKDTSARQDHRSPGQARSAPETPNADASGRTIYYDAQDAPTQADDYSQQTDAVKIQPSLLFGAKSANKAVVQSSTQSRVSVRSRPQEIAQQRDESKTSGFQFVSGHQARQATSATKVFTAPQVSAATKAPMPVPSRVTENASNISAQTQVAFAQPAVKAPQAVPIVPAKSAHLPGVVERFNPGPERANPIRAKTSAIERFNPTPERLGKLTKPTVSVLPLQSTSTPLERFNPTPDRSANPTKPSALPLQSTSTPLERFNPTPDRFVNPTKPPASSLKLEPVERFNPTPDRKEQLRKPHVTHSQAKLSQLPLERFNPTPDRQGKPTKSAASHQPSRLPPAPVESVSKQPVRLAKPQSSVAAAPRTPLERFNPTPDRSQKASKAQATHTTEKSLRTPLERFNPTPDKPSKLRQKPIERFNPVSDRP